MDVRIERSEQYPFNKYDHDNSYNIIISGVPEDIAERLMEKMKSYIFSIDNMPPFPLDNMTFPPLTKDENGNLQLPER
jgi:hypothetical protein